MKLKATHVALTEGRTIHLTARRSPTDPTVASVLRSAASNSKLGKGLSTIAKGRWRGFPLFTLTLEERATCPADCLRWAECYGNGMRFAHRFQAGSDLENRIEREVRALGQLYPYGFAVRLHVLGDFYSVGYVERWLQLLAEVPQLHVYGYTARHDCAIAQALSRVRESFPDRWWIRTSRNGSPENGLFASVEGAVPGAITCPEQTGKAQSCLDCGLCWATSKTIEFRDHDVLAKSRKMARGNA